MLIPKIYFLNCDLLHIRQQLSGAVRQESSSPYPPLPQLIKYNLMEETYGKRWNKRPQMYFSSNDCTAGKLKLISSIDYWYRKSQLHNGGNFKYFENSNYFTTVCLKCTTVWP